MQSVIIMHKSTSNPEFFFYQEVTRIHKGYSRGAWLGVKTPYIGGNDRQTSKCLHDKYNLAAEVTDNIFLA